MAREGISSCKDITAYLHCLHRCHVVLTTQKGNFTPVSVVRSLGIVLAIANDTEFSAGTNAVQSTVEPAHNALEAQ